MPIVFEEVTGEIAPPSGAERTQTDPRPRAPEQDSPLEREAVLRRRLALLAEREQRCLAD